MYLEGISPVIFTIGPLVIRWYGLFFALSILVGFYYIRKYGIKKGINEDLIYNVFLVLIISIVIGARAVYVAASWNYFMANPELIIRIDRGGLAFHGGLLGGVIGSWLFCKVKKVNWNLLADLAVPGIALGITLVRIANVFNQEILGREAALFFFDRHPTQIYGSVIGLFLLILHNYLARKTNLKPGYLFWNFVLGYTILRGLFEETFRDNPLVFWGYINEFWGAGFFTAVQVFTPFILLLTMIMLRQIRKS
jgi:phosphatidylglycerol---prolipoprotein diacylglyceryl transferase